MTYSRRLPRTLTVFLLVACFIPLLVTATEAKAKKKSRAITRAKNKAGKQARASKRSAPQLARRNYRGRQRNAEPAPQVMPAHHVVPDRIEVLEHGATNASDLTRWLHMPQPRAALNRAFADIEAVAATRRPSSVNIEPTRVLEIQLALAKRGFYACEMTGVYDQATVDAMRRFQAKHGISVTGYPTAHALKRLELDNW